MTQKDLAIKSGYSYSYIRRMESTKCKKHYSIKTIYKISKALNIDIEELLNEKEHIINYEINK